MKTIIAFMFALLISTAAYAVGNLGGSDNWKLATYVCSDYSPNVSTVGGNTDNCIEQTDEEKIDAMDSDHGGADDDDDDDD